MQRFVNPKILCLNIELELKAERDNAEVRYERRLRRSHEAALGQMLTQC